jgi:hypothetical protein
MNKKRAVLTGLIGYPLYAGVWFAITYIPYVNTSQWTQYITFYILFVPIALFLAKWYFREDSPSTAQKGLFLGISVAIVFSVIDNILGIPTNVGGGYADFYLNWYMFFMYIEIIFMFTYAGFEFDDTFTELS